MSDKRFMMISSDGHATGRMEDYTDYLEPVYREEFEEFCADFRLRGSYTSSPQTLAARTDPEVVEEWVEGIVEPGHLDGQWNVEKRLARMDADGVTGEVLIPDGGFPFVYGSPFHVYNHGLPVPDREHRNAGSRAYNRWLVDFMQAAPERFAGMASIDFADADSVDDSVAEIRWAAEAGLKGVMMPTFSEDMPLYDAVFEPIWSALEDHDLVLNSHTAISGTSTGFGPNLKVAPHPACAIGLMVPRTSFVTRNVFDHLVWCGVLERHPRLTVVMTEQTSGWVPGALADMDYSWDGSYRRRDLHEIVKRPPSEYFARQCYLGSSLLSLAEAKRRHDIGVDKMMIGVDYPHHEGTWQYGTREYLRATLGAAGVPEDEARQMLGSNAAAVYSFDVNKLAPIADRIGPRPDEVLVPPTEERYPRGDVHRPMVGTIA